MRTKIFIPCILLVSLVLWFLLHNRQQPKAQNKTQPEIFSAAPPKTLPAQNSKTNAIVKSLELDPTSPEKVKAWLKKSDQIEQALKEHAKDDWKTPIEFYGRVLDEGNNAVADAQVDFNCNDLSEKGTSYYHTRSDVNGLFSLKGIKGMLLGAGVSKDGYYSYDPHGQSFYYAGQNRNFVPEQGNPVIFRLRKKGEGADLVHYDKSFQLPKDGTPILIDLPEGKTTSSTQNAVKVETWINDSEKIDRWKFSWKCRVSVPGGGLQIYDELFPFLAPEENYVSEEVIDMPVTNNPSWSNQAHRNYYVRTADGKFGRMVFKMIPGGDHFCELNLYFNPSGSRNLEPK